jgi:archaellin
MNNLSKHKFGVIAIHDPDTSVTRTNGMNSGDRVIILINLSAIISSEGGLPARESVSGSMTPEIGIHAQFDTRAPAVFSKRIVSLS